MAFHKVFDYGAKFNGSDWDAAAIQELIYLRESKPASLNGGIIPIFLPQAGDEGPGGEIGGGARLEHPLLITKPGTTFGWREPNTGVFLANAGMPHVYLGPKAVTGPNLQPSLCPGPGHSLELGPCPGKTLEQRYGFVNFSDMLDVPNLNGRSALCVRFRLKLLQDIVSGHHLYYSAGSLHSGYGPHLKSAFGFEWNGLHGRKPLVTFKTTTGSHYIQCSLPCSLTANMEDKVHDYIVVDFAAGMLRVWLKPDANANPGAHATLIGSKFCGGTIVQEPFEDIMLGCSVPSFPAASGTLSIAPWCRIDDFQIWTKSLHTEPFAPMPSKYVHNNQVDSGLVVSCNWEAKHGPFVKIRQDWRQDSAGIGSWVQVKSPLQHGASDATLMNIRTVGGTCGIFAEWCPSINIVNPYIYQSRRLGIRLRDNCYWSKVNNAKIRYARRGGIWVSHQSETQISGAVIDGGHFPIVLSNNQIGSRVEKTTVTLAGNSYCGYLITDTIGGGAVTMDACSISDEEYNPTEFPLKAGVIAVGNNSFTLRDSRLYTCSRTGMSTANNAPSVILGAQTGRETAAIRDCIMDPDGSAPAQVVIEKPFAAKVLIDGARAVSAGFQVPLTRADQATMVDARG